VPDGNGPYRGSETWQREGRKHPRVMISRDCGDDVDLNCLESCLPLDSNVASDQPDEAVQRVGGSHPGNPGLEKEGAKVPEFRMKVAPDTVAYADGENHKLGGCL
jgi:hypothetical protein